MTHAPPATASVERRPEEIPDAGQGRLDELAALAEGVPIDRHRATALAAQVAMDMRARQRQAEARQAGKSLPSEPLFGKILPGARYLVARVIAIVVLIPLLVVATVVLMFVSAWAAVLPFGVLLGLVGFRVATARVRVRLAIERGCPSCNYDLSGLPDAIPHEWIAAHTGPRRCPECGEPWPLVL